MTDSYSIGSRLKQYIRLKKLKQNAVAQIVDVTPGFISQVVNGEEAITSKVIAGLVKNFADLNIDWLLRGAGEMLLEKKEVIHMPESGVLTGVMEPEAVYARVRGLRVEELPEILRSLQAEVEELRRRVEELEKEKK